MTGFPKSIRTVVIVAALVAVLAVGVFAIRSGAAADGSDAPWSAPTIARWTFPRGGRLFLASVGLAAGATVLALVLAFPVGVCLGSRPGAPPHPNPPPRRGEGDGFLPSPLTGEGQGGGASPAVVLSCCLGSRPGAPLTPSLSPRGRGGRVAALAGLVLVPLVIPPHLAAYVWRFTLEDVASFVVPGSGLWRSSGWRCLGVAWTLAAIYWPIIALAVAVGMRLRGRRLQEELATLAPPRAVFWRAVMPGLAPALIAGSGLFFLLALSNYGVPLMWNVPSQSVAVFARLAAFYSPHEALVLSIPLQATALGLCVLGLVWLARRPYGLDPGEVEAPSVRGAGRRATWSGALTALVLLVTVATPVVALGASPGLLKTLRADLFAGRSALAWGLVLAALGATGATGLGLALARGATGGLPASASRARNTGGQAASGTCRRVFAAAVEIVGLWAFFAPAAVLCMILAGLLNRPGWPGAVYDSLGIFVLAYGLRFFYIPWKVVRFQQRFAGRGQAETARLLGLGPPARLRLALAGSARAAVCVGWLIVFALVLGELEIAAFLVQPGRQPISVFLDNLMHYGRSAAVVKWSFIIVVTEIALAVVVLTMGFSQWRKWRVAR